MIRLTLALLFASFLPAQDPSRAVPDANWILVHIDTETTGLVAGYHELIDFGAVYTDLDGRVLGEFYRQIQPDHPERTSPRAREINGFDADLWRQRGALSSEQALRQWRSWEAQKFPGRRMIRVALSSPFDASFVDTWIRKHHLKLPSHYTFFFLDLPSMAWGLGFRELWGSQLAAKLGVADEPHTPLEHTGLSGAQVNVRIYQKLVEYRKKKLR